MKGYIRTLLRESLIGEGIIEVPKEVQAKFGVLFDLLKTKLDDYKQKAANRTHKNAYKAFNGFFKLKDRSNKDLSIDVSLYNNPKDVGSARMDAVNDNLLINLARFDINDNETFEDNLYHELVHAMDPLVRKGDVFNRYLNKKGAEPSGSKFALDKIKTDKGIAYKSEYDKTTEKYMKSQHEYTAFLSPLVANIKKIVGGDSNRLNWIIWIIENIIKNKDDKKADNIYRGTIGQLETMKSIKLFKDDDSYWAFLDRTFNTIKPWLSDEKVRKKLVKDIYKGLTT